MAESDVIRAVEQSTNTLSNLLATKPFWERVLPSVQAVVLIVGAAWAVFTYYLARHERALRPANIEVRTTISDLGVRNGMRFVKARIDVQNNGARAFVINAPYTIYACKMSRSVPSDHTIVGGTWEGSFAKETAPLSLRSGDAFGRGYWFESAERDDRSYVVAVPEGTYDLVAIHAQVQHCKVLDDSVHTRWERQADRSLKAVTVVLTDGHQEEYSHQKHQRWFKRDAIAMNESVAQLPLWQTPAQALTPLPQPGH